MTATLNTSEVTPAPAGPPRSFLLSLAAVLGVGPFAIDMYLASLPEIGAEFAAPSWMAPVSYTHLDVYKRQNLPRCGLCHGKYRGVEGSRRHSRPGECVPHGGTLGGGASRGMGECGPQVRVCSGWRSSLGAAEPWAMTAMRETHTVKDSSVPHHRAVAGG